MRYLTFSYINLYDKTQDIIQITKYSRGKCTLQLWTNNYFYEKENLVNRLKQLFTLNNYSMDFIENCFTTLIIKKNNSNNQQFPCPDKIKIFYQNQKNERYKIYEKVMKDIIKSNVKPTNMEQNLEIIIYYRNL